jgi:hypothetical protein
MSIELIFYTQVASIIGFILALFTLYRLLVSQKDSVIELLRERTSLLEEKIKELETQSPDVLVDLLNKRVNITKEEILRLNQDGYEHKEQIAEKETELEMLSQKLSKLNYFLAENELLCPHCQAPLLRRACHTIYGEYQGREVEADIEYVEYECGLIRDGAEQISPCCSVHSS